MEGFLDFRKYLLISLESMLWVYLLEIKGESVDTLLSR
jgi:hypothetical protein